MSKYGYRRELRKQERDADHIRLISENERLRALVAVADVLVAGMEECTALCEPCRMIRGQYLECRHRASIDAKL